MNKKLYLDWLKNKTNDTPIDGPNKLNESSRRHIRFMQNVIANLLDRNREEAKKKKDEEPETVSVEPRSSLVDLNLQKRDPAKSISIPQAAPSWSYNVKNALGLGTNSVYEEKIDENAIVLAKSAMPVAGKVLATTSKSTPVVARRIVPAARRIGSNPNAMTTVPTARRIGSNPNAMTTVPTAGKVLAKTSNPLAKPPVPAARRIGSNPLARPVRQIGSQLGKSVATKIGPETPDESAIVKPIGIAGPDGGLGKSNSRKPSPTTKSVHNRPNPYSAVTLKPETGEIEGGVQSGSVYEQAAQSPLPKPSSGRVRTGNPISTTGSAIRRLTRIPLRLEETSMSSLINNHIEKFLKSRHGQKLKTEAESVLTKKD